MATNSLLDRYNELRKKHSLPIFMKWTGTSESLQDAYNKLSGDAPKANGKAPEIKAKIKGVKRLPHGPERTAKVQAKAKKIMAREEKVQKNISRVRTNIENVTLAEICARLKEVPKKARVKLRAAYAMPHSNMPERIGGLWIFAPKDVPAIEKIVKSNLK